MRSVVVSGACALALALGGCGAGDDGGDERGSGATDRAQTSASPRLGDAYDPTTRRQAQKALDAALDDVFNAGSGSFASYVGFGGGSIKIEGQYDLVEEELESLTTMPASAEGDEPAGVRTRVVGRDVFAAPDFGPMSKCWFHYTGGVLTDLIPGFTADDASLAHVPPALTLADDAKARGFGTRSTFDVHAEVSARVALGMLSTKFASSVSDELPEQDDVRTSAIIRLRGGDVATMTVRAADVIESYAQADVDLFAKDEHEEAFKVGILTVSLSDLGAAVEVPVPPRESIVEVVGVDDVDSSGTACAAAAS